MSTDWFWEGNVVNSLERHFIGVGWSLVSKANTATRQAGIDLHMKKGDVELIIEAKGYPSTMYQRGPRQGTRKPTNPSIQARHWYAEALVCAIRRQKEHPSSIVAMAFPEMKVFDGRVEQTRDALEKLSLRVLFVSETGSVRTVIGDPI